MRRLLIITYHFPPSAASGSFRLLGFARHLPKCNWQVAVVAPPGLPWEPDDPELAKQIPLETIVHPAPYRRTRWNKPLRRLAPYAIWLRTALPACVRAVREACPAAVLTSGPPHWVHLCGLHLRRWHGIPWVADFRDPWVSASAFPLQGWFRQRWQGMWERKVLRRADAILANAEHACERLKAAFPHWQEKIFTVPNGFDPESFADPAPNGDRAEIQIVHSGEVYAGRDPRGFLDALQMLVKPPLLKPIAATFLGRPGPLATLVDERGLRGVVTMEGQVSHPRNLRALAAADILLLIDTPGRRIGVPAKLYEYIGAARPILALAEPDGDTSRTLKLSGLPYRIASPVDPMAIRQALADLIPLALAHQPGPTADSPFTRERITAGLTEILNRLAPAADLPAYLQRPMEVAR
jgi:glycosyltransferase involved in cell wall biosynthesis